MQDCVGHMKAIHKHMEDAPLGEKLMDSKFRSDENYVQERHASVASLLACLLHHYSKTSTTSNADLGLTIDREVHRSLP